MMTTQTTTSYVAEPVDSRCQWWSKLIPASFDVESIDLADKSSLSKLPFLRKGDDLELDEGDAILDSETNHHRKQRGYCVTIGIVRNGEIKFVQPTAATKSEIKSKATPEQWAKLRHGSGDVAACLRYLMAVRMGVVE